MKGISLSIETIIILVLAITVLTVLLMFFTSTEAPVENKIKLLNEQRELCYKYVETDQKCAGKDGKNEAPVTGVNVNLNIDKLLDTCNKLETQKCGKKGDTLSDDREKLTCIQNCCRMYCGFIAVPQG
ncbi:MAG: hypothetical protein HZA83_02765 [Thaumarchaeota archaeon]|nr:hypothetical protein [Nitrososphaerota archaeon]